MNNIYGFNQGYRERDMLSLLRFNYAYLFRNSSDSIQEDPRRENFIDMLRNSLCPKFKLKSFTSLVCLVIIALYLMMLHFGGIDRDSYFLSVYEETLRRFGGNSLADVRNCRQFFRWFTSLFLITDFLTLIIELILIMICYSNLEEEFGFKYSMVVYIGGGASGVLFGNVCNMCPIYYTTYSEIPPCLYASLGFFIAHIIKNWPQLESYGERTWSYVCFAVIYIIIIIYWSYSFYGYWYFEYQSCLGGLMAGITIGLIIIQVPLSEYEDQCKKIGQVLLSAQIGLCIILLYFLPCD